MSKTYTSNFKKRTGALSGQTPVYLLKIEHEELAVPIRIVNDNKPITVQGDLYQAFAFQVTLPDDFPDQIPHATISVDNVGREMTKWLDASLGGRGATVTLMQVMRDDPDTIEFSIEVDLMNTKQTITQISGDLGYDDILSRAGMPVLYRPDNTPAIF